MDKAFLNVRELSEKLAVSEKTIYRMLNTNSIPFAIKISGQWRFNSEKIEKWISGSHRMGTDQDPINYQISAVEALMNGLIIYRVHGESRDQLLDEILNISGLLTEENVAGIKKKILYKESIISSSLQGVAFMIPENDDSWMVQKTMLLFCFLEKPINFKGIDHIDSEVAIVLLAANKTEQAIVKTKLTRLLMEKSFISMLKEHPNRKELLDQIESFENQCFSGVNSYID
jgi:PTS system nitrogen regulatory IIA component